jgi:hypothetical protein
MKKALNIEEKKELKRLWKKASKMSDPDIVNNNLKDKANEIMKSLNEAYSNNIIPLKKQTTFYKV